MARKTQTFTITDEGRDQGKTFILTEMPAYQGIKWADRVLMAVLATGVDIPDNAMGAGMMGILAAGVANIGRIPYAIAEPLLDELLKCAQFQASPGVVTPIFTGNACQIEEFATFWTLRKAILELHVGFSAAAGNQTTGTATRPAA